MNIVNHTKLPEFVYPSFDPNGQPVVVCMLKARCEFGDGANGVGSIFPGTFTFEDEYNIDKLNSSLSIESDFAVFKPKTDVYFSDTYAHAPDEVPSTNWSCGFRIDDRIFKMIDIHGDRDWEYSLLSGWTLSSAHPISKIPIWYEDAFGGTWEDGHGNADAELMNPVGHGFVFGDVGDYDSIPAPSIMAQGSNCTKLGQKSKVVGLGPIARSWDPRRIRAGTFDASWKQDKWPFWPSDFYYAYFNAAPDDQQLFPYLTGNEEIELINLTPAGNCRFRLPFDGVLAAILTHQTGEQCCVEFSMDTLVFCVEEMEFHMTWRAAFRAEHPSQIEIVGAT